MVAADGAIERTAAELWGDSGAVQARYVDGGEWNEFHWADPLWSERDSSDQRWRTHVEGGAFEPPYRMAYFSQLALPTGFAGAMNENLVYEGPESSGRSRYCLEGADARVSGSSGGSGEGVIRFVVDPSGYVAEFVGVGTGDDTACWEGSLEFSTTKVVSGLRADLLSEWLATVDVLNSCRALVE